MAINQDKRIISFSPPDISEMEIDEVAETLRSGWITTGPRTKKLEQQLAQYIGVDTTTPNCVCLNSATASEELALRILGVREGDEVICPAYTYTSTAAAAIHVGAKVIFVDCQENSLEMDYEQMATKINEHTKAIIPVDLGGVPCDYEKIYKIVEEKRSIFRALDDQRSELSAFSTQIQKTLGRIAVVADCAHALGASRSINGVKLMSGTIADFSSFSFHAVKNFTTGEGGALVWRKITGVNDEELYHWLQLLSLHGQSKDALAKTQLGAWEYDIIAPLFKCNMTDIMAAIGLMQLQRYPSMLERRKEIIAKYDACCDEIGVDHILHYKDNFISSGHLYITRINGCTDQQRREIITKMAERGVSTNVHYKPLPMMTAYKAYGWDINDFPNAYRFYENEVTLPLHTKLMDQEVDYIVDKFIEVVKEIRG